jgi:hypothetical protein
MNKELVAQQLHELAQSISLGSQVPLSFAIETGQEGLGSPVTITRVRMVLVEQERVTRFAGEVPGRGDEEKLS